MSDLEKALASLFEGRSRSLADVTGTLNVQLTKEAEVLYRTYLPSGKSSTFKRHDWHAKELQRSRVVPSSTEESEDLTEPPT